MISLRRVFINRRKGAAIPPLRLFIAAEISDGLRNRIADATETVRSELEPAVRWLPPANYHITLNFLGDVPDAELPNLEKLMTGVASGLSAVEVQAGGSGCFPTCRRPRVIYVGIEDPAAALSGWHKALGDAVHRLLGIPGEEKPFRGHITVGYARDRRPGDREQVQEAVRRIGELAPTGPEELTKIVLFRSTLGPGGAVHEPLITCRL